MSISVVIPAFNASEHLAETLESVLAQTLKPDEILLIDDGSRDDTVVIAARYAPLVRVLRGANVGPSAARNFAVREAASEWVAFLDADDLWLPVKLQCQMQELEKNPGADLCYTARVQFSGEDGQKILTGRTIPVPPAAGIREALFRNTTFLPSSVLIRRSAFLAVGGFADGLRLVEDWDLWLRLLHSGAGFAACQEPLLLYRVHPENVSKQAALELLAAADRIYCRHVMPHLPIWTRWLRHRRILSEHEAAAALNLRLAGDPRYLATMLRSLLRDPSYGLHRYKVFAHMVFTTLKAGRDSR